MIVTLSGISFINTMGSGILIAALPRIAAAVGPRRKLDSGEYPRRSLHFNNRLSSRWYSCQPHYVLAAGCLLHVFSSIGDVVGPKPTWITGGYLFIVFAIALGFPKTALPGFSLSYMSRCRHLNVPADRRVPDYEYVSKGAVAEYLPCDERYGATAWICPGSGPR